MEVNTERRLERNTREKAFHTRMAAVSSLENGPGVAHTPFVPGGSNRITQQQGLQITQPRWSDKKKRISPKPSLTLALVLSLLDYLLYGKQAIVLWGSLWKGPSAQGHKLGVTSQRGTEVVFLLPCKWSWKRCPSHILRQDCNPSQQPNCHLLQDLDPEAPSEAHPKFLTHRNYRILFVVLSY